MRPGLLVPWNMTIFHPRRRSLTWTRYPLHQNMTRTRRLNIITSVTNTIHISVYYLQTYAHGACTVNVYIPLLYTDIGICIYESPCIYPYLCIQICDYKTTINLQIWIYIYNNNKICIKYVYIIPNSPLQSNPSKPPQTPAFHHHGSDPLDLAELEDGLPATATKPSRAPRVVWTNLTTKALWNLTSIIGCFQK